MEAETRSLSFVTIFICDCIVIGAVIYFNVQIALNHDEVESLIRRTGRKVGQLILQLAFVAPFGLISIRQAISVSSPLAALKECYFTLILTIHTFTSFSASQDALFNLEAFHERLFTLTDSIAIHHEEIRCLKWELRDRIRRIDEIFSCNWWMHLMGTSNIAVFVVIGVVGGRSSFLDRAIFLLADILGLLRMHHLAAGSSSLKDSCLKTEGGILKGHRDRETSSAIADGLIPLLAYREAWDILRVGCFPLETRGFVSFLTTSVTCTAVVLQFDYNLLRNLAQTSAESSPR